MFHEWVTGVDRDDEDEVLDEFEEDSIRSVRGIAKRIGIAKRTSNIEKTSVPSLCTAGAKPSISWLVK